MVKRIARWFVIFHGIAAFLCSFACLHEETPVPPPVKQVACGIHLPEDQYAHIGAPTEWWWYIGTLKSENGRIFGFEINASDVAIVKPQFSFAFTQIEISDVANQVNYQKVNPIVPQPENWAESDPKKPWYARLSGPSQKPEDGMVSMHSVLGDITTMSVAAAFIDSVTSTRCRLDLQMHQKGEPLLVWGTGCHEVDPKGETPLTKNNYYYSFTKLDAVGDIEIGNEKIAVKGLTWMDHEYGAFPSGSPTAPLVWMLQDMQLSNGVHISNYTEFGIKPEEGKAIKSYATLLWPDGRSTFIESVTTPYQPIYKSKKGITYFMKFEVDINIPDVKASLMIESLLPNQLFIDEKGTADVYEGVASCKGGFNGKDVSGTTWIEENLGLKAD